jgi:fructose-1,6-bisphosphatase II
VLTTHDLVTWDSASFVCTGITDGDLLDGVRYTSNAGTTESLVLRAKSGTIRSIHSRHASSKLRDRAG